MFLLQCSLAISLMIPQFSFSRRGFFLVIVDGNCIRIGSIVAISELIFNVACVGFISFFLCCCGNACLFFWLISESSGFVEPPCQSVRWCFAVRMLTCENRHPQKLCEFPGGNLVDGLPPESTCRLATATTHSM